jgi:hypothetical protein
MIAGPHRAAVRKPRHRVALLVLALVLLGVPGCEDTDLVPPKGPFGAADFLVLVDFPPGEEEGWSVSFIRKWSPTEISVDATFLAEGNGNASFRLPYSPIAHNLLILTRDSDDTESQAWRVRVLLEFPDGTTTEVPRTEYEPEQGRSWYSYYGPLNAELPPLEGTRVTVSSDTLVAVSCNSYISVFARSTTQPAALGTLQGELSWSALQFVWWEVPSFTFLLPDPRDVVVQYPTWTRPDGIHVMADGVELEADSCFESTGESCKDNTLECRYSW